MIYKKLTIIRAFTKNSDLVTRPKNYFKNLVRQYLKKLKTTGVLISQIPYLLKMATDKGLGKVFVTKVLLL